MTDSAASGDERVPEMDLPGAWSYSDFEGGPPDEVRGPDWTPPIRCTCPVRSDAIGPHLRGCPNHPEHEENR